MSVLEVRSLSKRYSGVSTFALQDVTLDVSRGEIVAVVGESGCGKTTLLRLISGLEVPTEGEVLLNGHVASTPRAIIPPERRGVGIVFQDYALFPHLTVLENVTFGLQAMRGRMRQGRAMETLSLVGMQHYTKRFPHELSGGQQQRVALARALAPQPSLLLLDEPFSNLDVVIKEQVREEVGQILRAADTTALYVVHDLEDVLSVANRIAILKSGALQQIDTPQVVYQRPKDEYVARLFGSTNLLPGVPRGDGFDTPVGYLAAAVARRHDTPVTLSIRPQDLEISTTEVGTTAATVRQTRFRGDHQEVVLALSTESGTEHELLLHTRPDRPLHIGQVLRVRPVAGSVRVLG